MLLLHKHFFSFHKTVETVFIEPTPNMQVSNTDGGSKISFFSSFFKMQSSTRWPCKGNSTSYITLRRDCVGLLCIAPFIANRLKALTSEKKNEQFH